jgi:hypothetical protein
LATAAAQFVLQFVSRIGAPEKSIALTYCWPEG